MHEFLYYAVYNENTLGYVFRSAYWKLDFFGIIHASGLRNSPFNNLSGAEPIIGNTDIIRKAAAKDFEEYNVSLPPDFYNYN